MNKTIRDHVMIGLLVVMIAGVAVIAGIALIASATAGVISWILR